ncbi:MAG: purine-nucleoside phosphorylase [Spirochaetaceae bacterium]|nr:purine-nucleoside phosphorylase [Spirochaetaceae bacterium]
MMAQFEQLCEARDFVKSRLGDVGSIGLILGSGLGDLSGRLADSASVSYDEVPHFPPSTVVGHSGRLVAGLMDGRRVLVMEGRPHYYEGHSMRQIAFPVYLMKFLGVRTLLITNACGGINLDYSPGMLMIIDDFINLVSDNPLIGINDERIGPRFPDMSEPYSLKLISQASRIADDLGIHYTRGVYAGFQGPYYETAAEIRAIAGMGADAVGMSTVPETIAANHAGMEVFALACITNMATGIQTVKHSHQRVLDIAKEASLDMGRWIAALIEHLPEDRL